MSESNDLLRLPRLYDDLAPFWPLISPRADYAAESAVILGALEEHLEGGSGRCRLTILELGAGGGQTLSHLTESFDAVAVDLSAPMLAHCRRLNPGVQTNVADMRTVRLGRTFDAVLAHDAIDYMVSIDDMRAVCATAAAHLEPNGVFLVAPTYVTENYCDFENAHDADRDERTEMAHVTFVHRPASSGTTYELVVTLLIRRDGKLRIEVDRHTCGLFSIPQWQSALRHAGFEVAGPVSTGENNPHVMFVATKRG